VQNFLNTFFWNPEDRRLRAFWRLSIQGVVWISLTMGITLAVLLAFWLVMISARAIPVEEWAGTTEELLDLMYEPLGLLTIQVTSFLVTLVTAWAAGRWLDRRRFVDFGFHFSRTWWLDLAFGLFLGALLMAFVFLTELAAGWVSVTGYAVSSVCGMPFLPALCVPLLMFLCAGISEELLTRGYQLKNLAEGLNSRAAGPVPAVLAATALSSVFFGFMHTMNPHMSLLSTLNIMAGGVFLALGYILTGELAISIGVHIAWNFFQGNVFGFPVSGLDPVAARFLAIRQDGPELITGGLFGPEGGLLGLAAMILGCVLILLWVAATRKKIAIAPSLARSPADAGPAGR
jgi:membrane protease YdiL (CAAX protease family)